MTTKRVERPYLCRAGCGRPRFDGAAFCEACRKANKQRARLPPLSETSIAPLADFLRDPSLLPKRPPGMR